MSKLNVNYEKGDSYMRESVVLQILIAFYHTLLYPCLQILTR